MEEKKRQTRTDATEKNEVEKDSTVKEGMHEKERKRGKKGKKEKQVLSKIEAKR